MGETSIVGMTQPLSHEDERKSRAGKEGRRRRTREERGMGEGRDGDEALSEPEHDLARD